ncbi:uncharacterized protein LOC126783140 [Argentina anserina]|uniref:uncharacterized protein LOC126783140 n=1 Tax=Argentina anserina TaxID=57926 RepID=UPI0021763887|nr:uncharacterized protein LOC126783140 [Potentilla anserina]
MAVCYILSKSLRSTHPIFSSSLSQVHVGKIILGIKHFGLQNQLFCSNRPTSTSDDHTEAAIKSSRKVKPTSLVTSDSVLALFREYEFTDTQISTIRAAIPRLALADAKKTLLPKLEFLSSVGMSRFHVATTVTSKPRLLNRSLENHIVPTYTFLKSVMLSDSMAVDVWKRSSWFFVDDLSKNVLPNIGFGRELGMSHLVFAILLTGCPRILRRKPEGFRELVGKVKEMGFDPQRQRFVTAICALDFKETTWKRCEKAYRKWGWSDDHILSAFKKDPQCMIMSEEKLMGIMDFLVNKMGWQSLTIAKYPPIFRYSLDEKMIPRFSVVRVLHLRGLIKQEELSLSGVLSNSEEYFLDRFVNKYIRRVPQLLDVYRGKVKIQDVQSLRHF